MIVMNGLESKNFQWSWALANVGLVLVCPLISSAAEVNSNNPLNPPAPVYWCPNKNPDQQYKTIPEQGCVPLVDEGDTGRTGEDGRVKERRQIKIENIQSEASMFLRRYNNFLDCCANDPASLVEIEDLEDQSSDILAAIQQTGLVNMSTSQRGFTLREIITPVARARDDLGKLRKRLERIAESKNRLDTLDYESAGRERQRIQEQEKAIKREFRPIRSPESARTGTEVEDTTLTNRFGTTIGNATIGDTTLPNATGTDIGTVVSPKSDQNLDLRPRRGLDTQDTTLPNRYGPELGGGNTPPTTLPYSFGLDIGPAQNPGGSSTTPSRVGPNIGDSSSNRRP